ncbi:MAG: DUF1638 domain-containing protein, partial [Phycisphaeraceae bacterium]|nr:DUF1638 domain-containing protein [Phycisphaeraceae bacterium]
MNQSRYMTIGCAVLARECYYCAAISKNIIDLTLLEQGLHDVGEEKMSSSLQREIDAIDQDKYDAILLAYGLCNNGIRNLHARIPLVVPRAHDCITLLMGSKEDYMAYFHENPGCFFRSVGWAERAHDNLSNPESTTRQMGMGTYEEYVEKYGEENAKYLMETLGDHLRNYSSLAYIDSNLPLDETYQKEAMDIAQEKAWKFLEVKGSTRLVLDLMNGAWDNSDFLVVEPGKTIQASYD